MSRFIEDEIEKPSPGRLAARWIIFFLMLACVAQIIHGLLLLKQGVPIGGIWRLISGSFFFLIFYATHWLMRN